MTGSVAAAQDPTASRAVAQFRARFGKAPTALIRSPGRVNLIGEHTDYNDGHVLPMAIDQALWMAIAPSDGELVLVSDELGGEVELVLRSLGERRADWGAYPQGVAWALHGAGYATVGFRGAIASSVPAGAGLSSSAALELAVARALLAHQSWEPTAVARIAQRAENDWVGVASGIMDQLACAAGRRGHALLIDCRSLATDHIPLPEGLSVVIMDTGTRRELAGTGYNDRQRQCRAAAAALGVPSLRDAVAEDLHRLADPLLRARACHVITENARTIAAAVAMRAGDRGSLGELLAESHRSLRADFAVSSLALDAIVAAATDAPGCIGARMTGGGFAGCAVALVDTEDLPRFGPSVTRRFTDATGTAPRLHVTAAAQGTELVDLDPG